MRDASDTRTNSSLAGSSRRSGGVAGMTLTLVGGTLLISQVVILLIFNVQAYLTLPSLNPQSLRASVLFGTETALGTLMISSSVVASRPSASGSAIAHLPLVSIVAIILLDEFMTIPAMGGPPIQILVQALSVFVIPADNFVMGGGIVLALAGAIVTVARSRRYSGELSL